MNAFLADPALEPLWRAAAAALDRKGLGWRGRLTLPELTPEGRRRLGVLVETRMSGTRRTVSLDAVAAGVERLTGTTFVDVLGTLGHAPAGRREAAMARHDATQQRRAALDAATSAHLGAASWAIAWRDAAWIDGLFARHTADEVTAAVARVGQVLTRAGSGRNRTEVAAQLFGDAHALDTSTRLAGLVSRALLARDGPADERGAWERAGLPLDLVSAPVLTWALPVLGAGGVTDAVRAMTAAGLPIQLSVLALRASPLTVAAGSPVLVVENPRLVEAAAERRLEAAVIIFRPRLKAVSHSGTPRSGTKSPIRIVRRDTTDPGAETPRPGSIGLIGGQWNQVASVSYGCRLSRLRRPAGGHNCEPRRFR